MYGGLCGTTKEERSLRRAAFRFHRPRPMRTSSRRTTPRDVTATSAPEEPQCGGNALDEEKLEEVLSWYAPTGQEDNSPSIQPSTVSTASLPRRLGLRSRRVLLPLPPPSNPRQRLATRMNDGEENSTAFNSVVTWAEYQLDEAIMRFTSSTDRLKGQARLLQAGCYILDELMSHLPGASSLWPRLRRVIFGGIYNNEEQFEPEDGLDPRLGSFGDIHHNSNRSFTDGEVKETYLEEAIELRSHLAISQQANRGVADFFLSRFSASRQFQRYKSALIALAFENWRTLTVRVNRWRERLLKSHARPHWRMQIAFVRWRNSVAMARRSLAEGAAVQAQRTLDALSETHDNQLVRLKATYEEELGRAQAAAESEKRQRDEIERYCTLQQVELVDALEEQAAELVRTETELRRWQHVAKSFRVESLGTPSKEMTGEAQQLCFIESRLAHSAPFSAVDHAKARASLERLLTAWISFECAESVQGEQVSVDLRSREVYFFLARKFTQTPAPSSLPANSSNRESFSDVYSSAVITLCSLTAFGLFPSLLLHCTNLRAVFSSDTFLRRHHPTAPLWVLSSMLVARALQGNSSRFQVLDALNAMFPPYEALMLPLRAGSPTHGLVETPTNRRWHHRSTQHRSTQHRHGSSGNISPPRRIHLTVAEASGTDRNAAPSNPLVGDAAFLQEVAEKVGRPVVFSSVTESDVGTDVIGFAAKLVEGAEAAKVWCGIARVVTSLIVRCRILDDAPTKHAADHETHSTDPRREFGDVWRRLSFSSVQGLPVPIDKDKTTA